MMVPRYHLNTVFIILSCFLILFNSSFSVVVGVRALSSPSPRTTKSQISSIARKLSRRTFVVGSAGLSSASFLSRVLVGKEEDISRIAAAASISAGDKPRCTDVDSCREIGERKIEQDLRDNPITRLDNGVQYKQLKPGYGTNLVQKSSKLDLIYSITSASGAYMYSQGFGYEKVNVGNGNLQRDR